MNIDSLQIKRVKGKWDTHKGYKPKDGELVLLNLNKVITITTTENSTTSINTQTHPVIVVGDGSSTLETLISSSTTRMYFSNGILKSVLTNLVATTPPKDVSSSAVTGTSKKAAPADHSHRVTKETLEDVLDTRGAETLSSFNCRRIKIGSSTPDNAEGSVGDIYIKY